MSFVTAFNRDRDSYQVPLALQEGGLLERLVTDLYLPDAFAAAGVGDYFGLSHRWAKGLPSSKVVSSFRAMWMQVVGRRLCRTPMQELALFTSLDSNLSRKSARIAAESGADFFTYSSYALEAFKDPVGRDRRKILFVYHPPSVGFMDLLREDVGRHAEVGWSFSLHEAEMANADGERLVEEIELADHVVCASSFTRRTIWETGASVSVSVVPYGCHAPNLTQGVTPRVSGAPARVLFVGQGVQRKGLHHLLKAWSQLDPKSAELTLVCSKIDPGIEKLAAASLVPVKRMGLLGQGDLDRAFDRADVFVMPSLAEGFGLVFLEALSSGCYCIGTPNTGMPDLDLPESAGCVVPCGDIEALRNALEKGVTMARTGLLDRGSIQSLARERSWERFRAGIRLVATQSPAD